MSQVQLMIVWHLHFWVERGLAVSSTLRHGLIKAELWLCSGSHIQLSSSPQCYMDQMKWLMWASIRQLLICYQGMAVTAGHNTEREGE